VYAKRHLPALVAAACLLFTATACDGDPDPGASTTPTSTPTLTPTPTSSKPTPPTIPAAAKNGLTVSSAEAFSRFYVSAMDYAQATGDVRLMQQWQDKKRCVNCRSIAGLYSQAYRAGGSVTGQLGTKIVRTLEGRLVDNDIAVIKFVTQSGPTALRKSAHARPTNFPGGVGEWEFTLLAVEGHWVTSEVVIKE
jgi:hypothetical protein